MRSAIFVGYNKKRKHDFFGGILSILLTVFVAVVFVMLLSSIASGYLSTSVNKIVSPSERAVELLNILYVVVMFFMVIYCFSCVNVLNIVSHLSYSFNTSFVISGFCAKLSDLATIIKYSNSFSPSPILFKSLISSFIKSYVNTL